MNFKLVIFDMGNTLLDFHAGEHTDEEKDLIGCNNMRLYLKKEHNIEVTNEMIKKDLVDMWYADFYKRQFLIELDVCAYIERFLMGIGRSSEIVKGLELMECFYRPYMDEVVVNEGAVETLKALESKVKIGVISNCILFDDLYLKTFEQQGLSRYINHFIFSYSRQIRKPDKRLFEEMLGNFGVMPKEAIMIGDSYKADILPAHELGMKTIHFSKKNYPGSVADVQISSLIEVLTAINRLR